MEICIQPGKGDDIMKKFLVLAGLICFVSIVYAPVAGPSGISDTFSEKFNSLLPPESSSVHSDYLFQQIALGSEYTVRLLDRITEQTGSLENKVDTIVEKFDVLIQQNQKIIDLLEKQQKNGD